MRIPSGKTDQYVYFKALDSTDYVTPETGLTGFTVYRSRNTGTATLYTTPTTSELDATNMPGVYALLIDEDTTIASGSDSEEMALHITKAGMAPVTRTIELYRRDTTTGRTLDVSSGGEAGLDWANVGSPTTTVALTGTTIATTQKVDVETIKTNPVVNGGTITFPTGATLASTTNITAGTIATVTNLTNLPSIPANWLTAAGTAADFGAEMATAIWTDTTAGDFTTALSIGKSVMNGVALGTGLTINAYTGNTPQTGDSFALIGATGSGLTSLATQASVNTIDDFLDTEIAAIKAKTDSLTFTVAGQVDANALAISGDATAADNAEAFFDGTGYAGTNNIIPTVTTVTNLTNAPTNGDLTATMKTSVTTAVPTAAQNATAVLTTAMTESYAADGAAPTLAQSQFLQQQALTEFSISGTTTTIKKLDGSTTAATLTLNSATAPTSVTRAS